MVEYTGLEKYEDAALRLILKNYDGYLHYRCVKSVQISFFWSVFSSIRTEYGAEKTQYLGTFHAVYVRLPLCWSGSEDGDIIGKTRGYRIKGRWFWNVILVIKIITFKSSLDSCTSIPWSLDSFGTPGYGSKPKKKMHTTAIVEWFGGLGVGSYFTWEGGKWIAKGRSLPEGNESRGKLWLAVTIFIIGSLNLFSKEPTLRYRKILKLPGLQLKEDSNYQLYFFQYHVQV